MQDMKAIFLIRLCASECFDLQDFSSALKFQTTKAACVGLSGIERKLSLNPDGCALSAANWDKLDWCGKNYERIFIAADTTDIDALKKLGSALKAKYEDRLHVAVLIGNPLEFYNDHAFWRSHYDEPGSQSFFSKNLYRIDKFLAMAEQTAPSGLHVLAAESNTGSQEKLFKLAGIKFENHKKHLPVPVSHAAKDVSKFYHIPKMYEILGQEDWQRIASQFESMLTRSAPAEKFHLLDGLVKKYWRFAVKRYPQLEKLIHYDVDVFANAPEYQGYDRHKLANLMPDGFVSHFGYLINGFTGFQKPLFNEFKAIEIPRPKPKCAVITFSYNHEKFIAECIESIAAQKDCDFEHVIFDDASTDGTQDIIRQYAQKYSHIKPVLFRRKPGSTIGPAFQSLRNEYVALCDGDDYFTDPLKLKKQMDFLDAHSDHAVCGHFAEVRFENGKEAHIFPARAFIGQKKSFSLEDLLQGNFLQTCSVMYRWRFRNGLPVWFNPLLRPADWYWHVLHAENGRIGFIPETMAVYRRHANACYASADSGDSERHFVQHGHRELEVFEELDCHFHGKYHNDFELLASGAFARLFSYGTKHEDFTPYGKAALLFPSFEKEFRTRLLSMDANTLSNSS